jgi:protein-S-isoprenylcysteine O-methyltransferase Ste14
MSNIEIIRLILINLFILIPLLSYFYLKNFNYTIPDYIKNIAPVIMLIALICIIKTSYDLGNDYSFTLQIRKDHKLVDTGIYKYIRHPMYFCGLLFIVGQSLLIPNLIGNISNLIVIYVFATGRIPDEEKMMIKEFGNAYLEYIKSTKSVIPFVL